jgi:hypothetical protein
MPEFCEKCECKPCQCKRLAEARKSGATHCIVCGKKFQLRGGYSGLDMCGPCVTGDASTIDEE